MAGRDVGKAKVPGRSNQPAAQHRLQTVGKRSAVQAAAQTNTTKAPQAYEAFLAQDPSGKIIAESAIQDMTQAVWALQRRAPATQKFPVTIPNPIEVDGSIEEYPPPSMHPWKTQIGNHQIWLRGTVEIDAKRSPPVFHVVMMMTIKPLGHSRFKRYELQRTFHFTTEEIEHAPLELGVLQT